MDEDTIEQRIAEEQRKVRVDSYQGVVSRGGWAGSGRTLWAISTIGAVIGAATGLVAPFFPLLVGVGSLTAAAAAVPASMAVFAATGIGMGFGGGLMMGRISGAASAASEENERRLKEWMIRQKITCNPEATIAPEGAPPPPTKNFFTLGKKEAYDTYINPRVGLLFAAIGAVGGLILAAAFVATGGTVGAIMPALATLMGGAEIAANSAAVAAYTAGVLATFGATFALNMPIVTSDVTSFFGKLTSGELLGRKYGTGNTPQPEKLESLQNTPVMREVDFPQKSYAAYINQQKTKMVIDQPVISR